ncbi:YheC/YheD family protein [Paenibacillus woosongensis]|uniref:YheC/YheD family protein n=1 Tax=Paenibacillus woosongensis TaxID=307580 RepID=A0A7X2YZ41_9BACL|nr:YheC/YheD family protein [Paenibacillus woosongensis]MUG44108.1 YheC/YheD family protein [Paenibacillus woosongensis]
MGQDRVGILLNSSMYRGIPQRKTGQESIANYEEAARANGFIPCFLRLGDIDTGSNRSVAYVQDGYDYVKKTIPTPRVIHNRALYKDAGSHRKINSLISQGVCIFNVNNRYGKNVIHRILQEDPRLSEYLPETAEASPASLRRMMAKYDDLVLKPVRGSVGYGIMRIRRDDTTWKLMKPGKTKRGWITDRIAKENVPAWLYRRFVQTPYLIQQRIPLAEYDARPLDLRVTVQRGAFGTWGITGMFVKIAPMNSFLSNLGKGGQPYPVEVLAQCLPPKMVPDILYHVEYVSLTIAKHLSSRLPLLADLGIDIGLTENGQLYFIECNGRDQRYGFRKAGLTDIWKDTYQRPMDFARYLYDLDNIQN